jgi:hypothetical protein
MLSKVQDAQGCDILKSIRLIDGPGRKRTDPSNPRPASGSCLGVNLSNFSGTACRTEGRSIESI